VPDLDGVLTMADCLVRYDERAHGAHEGKRRERRNHKGTARGLEAGEESTRRPVVEIHRAVVTGDALIDCRR
jgi:hypothetical protein